MFCIPVLFDAKYIVSTTRLILAQPDSHLINVKYVQLESTTHHLKKEKKQHASSAEQSTTSYYNKFLQKTEDNWTAKNQHTPASSQLCIIGRYGREQAHCKLYYVQQPLAIAHQDNTWSSLGVHSSAWQARITGFISQYCANLCRA
jgi:hypothetical protein